MYDRKLTVFVITKLRFTQPYDLRFESVLAGSRGNLANYVLPFQRPNEPEKVLNGENKGDTHLVIFARPYRSYLQVS